jgi:3-methyladenine DNA glycosylase AlkD
MTARAARDGFAGALLDRLDRAYARHANAARAAGAEAYLRNQFRFIGLTTPLRRALDRQARQGLPPPTERDLLKFARACWNRPQREFQHAAVDALARWERILTPRALPALERLITTKSWWDTVDGLAPRVVGPLVLRTPALVETIDRWLASDNLWLQRSAIIHQLHYKARTNEARLFRYCRLRAGCADFFVRKAIGWALREYSKTRPDAVRAFLARHGAALSGLSRREAMKRFDRPSP